jgi:hypothetical protein
LIPLGALRVRPKRIEFNKQEQKLIITNYLIGSRKVKIKQAKLFSGSLLLAKQVAWFL